MAHVSLREVVESNVRPVMDLAVRADQRRYVADNARTIAEHAYADEAWLRSIYADEVPVGLLLLSERRSLPRYYLWRFMIDARHQGCGYGRAAMGLLVEYVRTLPNAFELFVEILRQLLSTRRRVRIK